MSAEGCIRRAQAGRTADLARALDIALADYYRRHGNASFKVTALRVLDAFEDGAQRVEFTVVSA